LHGGAWSSPEKVDAASAAGLLVSLDWDFGFENESAFASLKSEVLSEGLPFDSKRAATTALFDYFETFYNRRRLHSSLGS